MRLLVSLEAVREQSTLQNADACYKRAWHRVRELSFEKAPNNPSAIPVDRPDLVAQARVIFDEEFSSSLKPLYEVLIVADKTLRDFEAAQYVIFSVIGDDASGLDSHDTAEGSPVSEQASRCSVCANSYANWRLPTRILGTRLPKKKEFFSFFATLSQFCRPSFAEAYAREGLSGLIFDPLPQSQTQGVDLLAVRMAQHEWSDRSGACGGCGMKTNVRYTEFFNHDEVYSRDFQVVRVFADHFFVLSQRAVHFLAARSHTRLHDAELPILPGYMAEWIGPEDKLFSHGEYPTKVLMGTQYRASHAQDEKARLN